MRRLLSALPLSLLLAALPAQTESASQSPFRLVPADANFVIRMAAPAKWKQSFGTTQIAKLFSSQTLAPMVAAMEQNYQKALEQARKEAGFDADLLDAMLTDYTGEMVFALRVDMADLEEMMQSGEPPELEGVIAFTPGGNYDLAKLCAAVVQAAEKEAPSRTKMRDLEIGAVKARLVDNDDGEPDVTLPTMVDGQMVMFFGSDVEKQIQRATSGGAHFQGGNADSSLFVHAELGSLMKAITSFAGMMADMQGAPFDASQLLRDLGLESIASFDMSIAADGKHMAMEMELGTTGAERGLLDVLMPKAGAGTPKLVKFVPADAAAFSVGTLDLGALYNTIAKVWKGMEDEAPMSWSDAMAAFTEGAKVRLKEDLIDHLGNELLTIANPPTEGFDADEAGNPFAAISQATAGSCICLGLKDSKAFGESLEKVVRASGMHAARKSEEYQGATIHRLAVGGVLEVEYAITDGMLLLGIGDHDNTKQSLRSVLDVHKAGGNELPAAIKAQIDSLPAGWCSVGVSPIASTLGAAADMAESAGRARGRDAMLISLMRGISQDLKRLGIEKMVGTSYATEKGLRMMMRW
jgi:hypothetical protein